MIYLVCYDVSTESKEGRRRLRRVAQACKDYGVRVQKSVFECNVSDVEWLCLRSRLLEEYDPERDSLRFYPLDQGSVGRVEHYGVAKPPDLDGALVI